MSNRIYKKVTTFLVADDGPTAVEYAILLALLAGMMVASIFYVGEQGNAISNDVVNGLDNALSNR